MNVSPCYREAYMSKKTSEVARAYLVLSLCGVKPLVKHNAKVSPPPQTCLVVTAGSVPGHQASTVFYRCIVSFPHDGTGTIGWSDFREKNLDTQHFVPNC